MTGLAEWLLDQISDDEKATEHALWSEPDPWRLGNYCEYGHITIDPRRVLAECAAKRAIIAEHEPREWWVDGQRQDACLRCSNWTNELDDDVEPHPCLTLSLLAAPYSDRPGFREEWRV